MSYIVGHNWRDLFEVIIVQAGKPHFFANIGKPFREVDMMRRVGRWDKVYQLEKGKIYAGGTISQFQQLTGWTGHSVMYFGGETSPVQPEYSSLLTLLTPQTTRMPTWPT